MPLLPVHIEEIKYPRVQIIHNGREVNYFRKSIYNTDITACLDFPSLSMPYWKGVSEDIEGDLSINMEFSCQTGDDNKLIGIARAIEPYFKK